MKKRLLMLTGLMVILIGAIIFFATNYFYNEAVKRGVEVELYRGDKGQSVEAINQSKENPNLEEARSWYKQQQFEEDIQISYDGLELYAKYLENEKPEQKAVILAHGYRGNGDKMKDYVKFYYEQGFDVLIPDARGHGKSEGEYVGYGWHDRLDYLGWIDLLIEKYQTKDIVLHGNSMGAATVLMVSGENVPEEVKGIVADSSYTTVKEELTYQLKHLYNLPAFPLLDLTSFMTSIRSGYSFEVASAIDQVKNNRLPLFIIHGEDDDLVPTEMAYQLYDAAVGEKELWIVPNAGHTKAHEVSMIEYEEKLLDFINNKVFASR